MSATPLRSRLRRALFPQPDPVAGGPVTLSHRRIFILPSRRGQGLGVLLCIQWLAAMNYGNNLAYMLTFLLAAVAMVSTLYSYRNLAGLRLRPGHSAPAFAGEWAAFEVSAENTTALTRHGVWLQSEHAEPVRLNLPPEDTVSVELRVKAEQRGWLDLGTVTVFTVFPLGICRAWSSLRLGQRVLVYPKPAADALPFPGSGALGGTGMRSSQHQQPGTEDFYGFQCYQPGDALKRIHWKGIAKGQGVQVKQFSSEESDVLHLAWDETPGTDRELRLSRLCRWVLDAEQASLRYRLTLPGTSLGPGRGPVHCTRCLEALALFDPKNRD